jgi:hypothetical protein
LHANLIFEHVSNHVFHPVTGKKQSLDSLINGTDKVSWLSSLSNEWGRLAQGNDNGVASTDTIELS